MIELVNFLELEVECKKVTSDDIIVYEYKSHSVIIPKKGENVYLNYYKKSIAVFTITDNNIHIIIDRLKKIFNMKFPYNIDEDLNAPNIRENVRLEALKLDDKNNIINLGRLTNYNYVIYEECLVFLSFYSKEVVYCIQLSPVNKDYKKEREPMLTHLEAKKEEKKSRLKEIFDIVVEREDYKYKITQELLEIGCIKEKDMYVFSDKIFIKVGDKLSLNIKDTGINETFCIGAYTINNIIEYLQNIYL